MVFLFLLLLSLCFFWFAPTLQERAYHLSEVGFNASNQGQGPTYMTMVTAFCVLLSLMKIMKHANGLFHMSFRIGGSGWGGSFQGIWRIYKQGIHEHNERRGRCRLRCIYVMSR